MTDSTITVAEDTWVEAGQEISTPEELRVYVAQLRSTVLHMQSGLGRAAWGALTGRSWIDTPATERQNVPDIISDHLEMTVTPAGTTAKDATYRQSLATLLGALEAVDRATLTVWLAQAAVHDPDQRA
ncbi:hypothetical protein [Streptomyces sp. NBC_01233]|uniref:hypothetical protein n=1 Tax=Streptomyces sp. NBC_01233 TaxID=2903787 RepID=UPI002E139395|nr:hypothetical protein OG332_47645 [Streptomyces sp. NBC_01233]